MIVKINLFAAAKEIVGEKTVEFVLEDAATLGDLKQAFVKQYPAATELVGRSAFSVDEDYARDESVLHPGVEVGFIPPVSGG